MLMSFMKSSTSILILNALHFSIKLALKNRKKIDEMRNSWDMFAFISCIVLVCSLNISNVSLFFRKLRDLNYNQNWQKVTFKNERIKYENRNEKREMKILENFELSRSYAYFIDVTAQWEDIKRHLI